MEHLVFLTGRLAEPALRKVLAQLCTPAAGNEVPFSYEVIELGLQVAGLMTADMIRRRLQPDRLAGSDASPRVDRLIVPGRCRGDLDALSLHYGIPVQRGPEELKDLPQFFKRGGVAPQLDDYRVAIFAEIVDAPRLTVAQIVERARSLKADGADVIDLGCLPATAFDHLEDSVRALKSEGFKVSVDSVSSDELLRGGRAGADYLLSLTVDTLWIADEVASIPVLIARDPQDEAALYAAIDAMTARGKPFLADSILDPLPFGLLASLCRYQRLRERYPQAPIMLGVGNLTELTEADTSGINAVLLGIAAELDAAALLTTQVSAHARRAVREADWARRIMHAAHTDRSLPKGYGGALMTTHDKQPWPDSADEIAAIAAQVKDPNFRVQVAAEGIHVYNRDGLRRDVDPFELWPQLGLQGDAGHAFYMGVELARAQIAWQLGKRYVQDQPLAWGAAFEPKPEDLAAWCAPGRTRAKPDQGD
ncbi:MAG: dihydropteroate synthase [Burkholderiales bacterium]|nr:dihydropteroate synthase [Burkholderiales bacterium]